MTDFYEKREKFLNKISKLANSADFPVTDIRLRQIPEPGIALPEDTDPETARKIMRIYNEVFK